MIINITMSSSNRKKKGCLGCSPTRATFPSTCPCLPILLLQKDDFLLAKSPVVLTESTASIVSLCTTVPILRILCVFRDLNRHKEAAAGDSGEGKFLNATGKSYLMKLSCMQRMRRKVSVYSKATGAWCGPNRRVSSQSRYSSSLFNHISS